MTQLTFEFAIVSLRKTVFKLNVYTNRKHSMRHKLRGNLPFNFHMVETNCKPCYYDTVISPTDQIGFLL